MAEFTYISEAGNSRLHMNQDAVFARQIDAAGLYVVADGMGGTKDGDRASRMIVEKMAQWWQQVEANMTSLWFEDAVEDLKEQLLQANRKVLLSTEPGTMTGSTVVLLFILGQRYALLWAGDSRCSVYTRDDLRVNREQLSSDDVWQNSARLTRGLTKEEIRHHRQYGRLTKAIGIKEQVRLNERIGKIQSPSLFTLESDGIYKYIEEDMVDRPCVIALKDGNLEEAVRAVRTAVYNAGARDNLSMILVRTDGYQDE